MLALRDRVLGRRRRRGRALVARTAASRRRAAFLSRQAALGRSGMLVAHVARAARPWILRGARMSIITEHESQQIEQANTSGTHARRLHPRPLAAPEQLGSLGDRVRGGGLRAADPGLAGRPRHRRGGERPPRRVRAQDGRAGRRSLRRGDRQADEEARRASGTRSAACWPRSSPAGVSRRSRSRSILRRSAACCRCRSRRSSRRGPSSATRRTAAAPCRSRTSSSATRFANAVLGGRGEGAVRRVRGARLRCARCSRQRRPT